MYDAIKVGYRLLDEAADYGNEKEAGEGVRRAIADGLVKREELCVCSSEFSSLVKHQSISDVGFSHNFQSESITGDCFSQGPRLLTHHELF